MGTSIQKISEWVEKAISKSRTPLTVIPSIILVCSAVQRPGLSAKSIAANIIRRQSEAGAPVGRAKDGSQSISEAMEVIRVEEIVKAIKMDARIDAAIAPGSIQVAGTVQTAAGPGTFTGTNINIPSLNGIIR